MYFKFNGKRREKGYESVGRMILYIHLWSCPNFKAIIYTHKQEKILILKKKGLFSLHGKKRPFTAFHVKKILDTASTNFSKNIKRLAHRNYAVSSSARNPGDRFSKSVVNRT